MFRLLPRAFIYHVVLPFWGVTPITVLLVIIMRPSFLLDHPLVWSCASVGWILASLLLFASMLVEGGNSPTQMLQGLGGLVCTFGIGLPAIAVSLLPLLGSPAHFMHSMIEEGCKVKLRLPARAEQEDFGKTLFLVGIDISTSFLKDHEDPKVAMIHRTLGSILKPEGDLSLGSSLNPEDVVQHYVFASDSAHLDVLSNETSSGVGSEARRVDNVERLARVVSRYLQEKEFSDPEADVNIDRSVTDIPKFLDDRVCAELRNGAERFSWVRVILFSDLQSSFNGDSPTANDAMRLRNIEACVRKHKNASILVFSMDSNVGTEDSANLDVRYHLESNLPIPQWQEVNLLRFDEARAGEKVLIPSILYTETVQDSVLYLKHKGGPHWGSVASSLQLPVSEEADNVFIGLQSLADGSCDLRVRFMVERTDDFILGFRDGDERSKLLVRAASEQNPLQIELVSPNRISPQTQCELQVAIPRQSVLYRIPIVVLPVMEDGTLNMFQWLLLSLHLFPLVLAAFVWRSRGRGSA